MNKKKLSGDLINTSEVKGLLVIFINFFILAAAAQKPCIVFSAIKKWSSVGEGTISSDGNCVSYHIYNQPAGNNKLVVQSAGDNWKREFNGANSESFSEDGGRLFFKTGDSLWQLTLVTNNLLYVSRENKPAQTDALNEQRAYIATQNKTAQAVHELWYHKPGRDSAIKLIDDQDLGFEGMEISDMAPQFSKDGSMIFFWIKETKSKAKPGAVQMDLWSFTDKVMQTIQLSEAKQEVFYASVINITNKKIIRIEQQDEHVVARTDDFALVVHGTGNNDLLPETNWNVSTRPAYYLKSLKDGSEQLIRDNVVYHDEGAGMSPAGKWMIYFDFQQKSYFSYEIATGIIRNITKACNANWLDEENDRPEPSLCWVPWRDTWLADDEAVLIYDNYDIWQIDPAGVKLPINLTNFYGAKHHIKFEVLYPGEVLSNVSDKKKIILTAFNKLNKDRGFFKTSINVQRDPELCTMGPFIFSDWLEGFPYGEPVKAKNADVYMVMRINAEEAPNYFITNDFKNFKQLSNIQPQKEYNWFTTELVHWKTFDGKISAGILYKPEDFDSTKQYPVLFNYYEQRSKELNLFLRPKVSYDNINIPWFVSRGYLVFVPDIHYKVGEPGQSAYNAIVSAAEYLSKKPWVDAKRMGIQGHSFGGYETDYIITHSKLFAAACSASGTSDLISFYGSADRTSYPTQWAEKAQGRMLYSPWQVQLQYITNSPVFKADNVRTPFLMMNNKNDRNVPFGQGVEFFTALRRLGKRAWLLQYDDGSHSLDPRSNSATDYTIRMTQFFDHYLKDSACPRWMMYGIPAREKGIDNGYELIKEKDPKTGKWVTPKEGGLLTDDENKKVEVLKKRKPVTVTIE
jgi:dipeptidyl aminopeptidase/acylaminoacyl peptidase